MGSSDESGGNASDDDTASVWSETSSITSRKSADIQKRALMKQMIYGKYDNLEEGIPRFDSDDE